MHASGDVGGRKLLRDARRGDRQALEQVIRKYEGLVRRTATRYRGMGLPFEDIVQEGDIGLLEAINSFDEARGAPFEAFARWHIRHAITDALTAQTRLVRLPKQVVERRRAIARTASELTAKSGHAPTAVEITAATGLAPESIEAIQAIPTAPISLDASIAPGSDGAIVDLIEDPAASDPQAEVLALHRAEVIGQALERLPDRQRQVIERRFGFGRPAMTHGELSRELHLCPQRTRAIEQEALYRLAKMLERDPTFDRPLWSDWTLEFAGRTRAVNRERDDVARRRRRPTRHPTARSSCVRRPMSTDAVLRRRRDKTPHAAPR